jgi:hypothetical protein
MNGKKKFQKSKYRKNEGFGSWAGPILLQDTMIQFGIGISKSESFKK